MTSVSLAERLLRLATGRHDLAEAITGDLIATGRGRLWLLAASAGIAVRYLFDRITRRFETRRFTPPSSKRPVLMNNLLFDLRHALRGLRNSPNFAAVAILTVALGVGANVAIYSLVHGIMLAPLPYPQQADIVRIWPGHSLTMGWVEAFRATESFSAIAGVTGARATITGRGDPMELVGGSVTAGHFDVLGVRPALGRPFHEDDQDPGAEPVIILSHALWQSGFGGDTAVVGSLVDIAEGAGQRPRVIGVMPKGHIGLREEWEYWTPSVVNPENDYPMSSEGCFCWQLVARMAPGVSQETADAEVQLLARRIREQSPEDMREEALATAVVQPLLDDMVGDADTSLTMLLGAVGLVLLIACLNVANLLLARGEGRRRELAIRSAVGAGRFRLVAQTVYESLALGLAGGAVGIGIAVGSMHYFRGAIADVLPRTGGVAVNGPVLVFALLVTMVASVAFGLAPALGALRTDPASVLAYRAGTSGRRHRRIRSALVTVEVAVAVILAIGAGLMVRTIRSLNAVEPGFRTENILTLMLQQPGAEYRTVADVDRYFRELRQRLATLPGVQSVATINSLPLTGSGWGWHYTVDTEPLPEGASMPNARFRLISPDYFGSLDISLLAGRDLIEADIDGPDEVALVNQSFVDRHYDSPTDALGRTVSLNTGHAFRIVGVVPDNLHRSLASPAAPEMYRPRLFFPVRRRYVVIATASDPEPMAATVRDAVWEVDPNVPITDMRTMAAVREHSTRESQFYLEVLGAFAILALVLGAIGVYGVLSFLVTQSRQGIGIRMALGADGYRVLRETMASGLKPVLVGLALGTAGAAAATRLLENLLFGVTPTDTTTFLTVSGVVMATALLATLVPARRASLVDPMRTLRTE